MAGRLDWPEEGLDASGGHVVDLHYGDRLRVEPGVAVDRAVRVWRRRGRMFPEPDQGIYDLAARRGASAGAGDHVDERPLGRRLHPIAGGVGLLVRLLAD